MGFHVSFQECMVPVAIPPLKPEAAAMPHRHADEDLQPGSWILFWGLYTVS